MNDTELEEVIATAVPLTWWQRYPGLLFVAVAAGVFVAIRFVKRKA